MSPNRLNGSVAGLQTTASPADGDTDGAKVGAATGLVDGAADEATGACATGVGAGVVAVAQPTRAINNPRAAIL
jgi:hypothetical protein